MLLRNDSLYVDDSARIAIHEDEREANLLKRASARPSKRN